jgi:3-oxoacyl-[acyl-carrier-protein] synthase-3
VASIPASRLAYVVATSEYVPSTVRDNAYFSAKSGKDGEWYTRRTGIEERRKADDAENSATMATRSVERLIATLGGSLPPIDTIISACYTPWDSIGTNAHVVQRQFGFKNARVFELTSACSSFLNALEVVSTFIESGKSRNALIVASEHNTLYSDEITEHLWGDGASTVLVTDTPHPPHSLKVICTRTYGRAELGHGTEAVQMRPRAGGLQMPLGKEVFQNACEQMAAIALEVLSEHGMRIDDVALFVPHQANLRILRALGEKLGIPDERVATTIQALGNTGSASVPITLHRYWDRVPAAGRVMLLSFGGGYSVGAALLERDG